MSPAEEGGMGLQSLCFYIRRRTKSRNATVLPFGITVAFFMAVLRPFFKPDKNNEPAEKYKRAKILELAKQYNIQFIIDDSPANIEEFTKLGFLTLKPNVIFRDLK